MFISKQEKNHLFRKIEGLEQSFDDLFKSFSYIQEKLRIEVMPTLEKQNLKKQKRAEYGKMYYAKKKLAKQDAASTTGQPV
jgi:methionyl-tRNA formyltransferase